LVRTSRGGVVRLYGPVVFIVDERSSKRTRPPASPHRRADNIAASAWVTCWKAPCAPRSLGLPQRGLQLRVGGAGVGPPLLRLAVAQPAVIERNLCSTTLKLPAGQRLGERRGFLGKTAGNTAVSNGR